MGIESDRMVFDYLSRVGDLAQQQHLPPGERRALVAGLRDEIDRRRATHGKESPSAVRGILGDLGTPDEVVGRAAASAKPDAPAPVDPPADPPGRRTTWWSDAPAEPATAPVPRPRATEPSPSQTDDWWKDDDDLGAPGFVGGVEAPELFRPPAPDPEEPEEPGPPEPPARRGLRLLRRLRRTTEKSPAEAAPEEEGTPTRLLAHPFLLLAAALLLAGAVFGWLLALAAGWLLAYGSRRLTPGEIKTTVFVLPGLAAATAAVWLWGRTEGRWGPPLPAGGDALGAAVTEAWPWTLKAAAVASALFLLRRARRP
ncbi:hypothetical protein [Streptomyces sp. CC208A]|uniref:hypothetical protein n=1 Tax=Streptomyces sp. CC208A TaxID=3044573 RepID=UPI0024A9186A|nr:hypothetical protein [Streptomyces sp. CC208A]